MNAPSCEARRVLAIDPTSKGLGFAVFEGPTVLIDWGVKHRFGDRNGECLELASDLIKRYQPDTLVLEQTDAKGCLRRSRVRRLIEDLLTLARQHHLKARPISRRTVLRCFSPKGSATKREVAVALAQRFPEIAHHLPPARRPWMSEDARMGIFDAAGFGWASYESWRGEARAPSLFAVETP